MCVQKCACERVFVCLMWGRQKKRRRRRRRKQFGEKGTKRKRLWKRLKLEEKERKGNVIFNIYFLVVVSTVIHTGPPFDIASCCVFAFVFCSFFNQRLGLFLRHLVYVWLIITPLNWTKCVRVCVLKQISNKTISRIFIFGAQWDIVVALLKKFISIKYFDWNTPKIVRQRQQQYNSIHRNLNYFNKYLTGARVKKVSNHFVWFRFTPFWGFMCLIEFVSLFFCLLLSFVSAAAQEKMNWIICKWKQ